MVRCSASPITTLAGGDLDAIFFGGKIVWLGGGRRIACSDTGLYSDEPVGFRPEAAGRIRRHFFSLSNRSRISVALPLGVSAKLATLKAQLTGLVMKALAADVFER